MSDILMQGLSILFIVGVVMFIFKFMERRWLNKFHKAGLLRIDRYDEEELSQFMNWLFTRRGYDIEKSGPSGGETAVLLAAKGEQRIAAFGIKTGDKVGLREIQEVLSAMKKFNCQRGIVLTNSYFNYPAQATAKNLAVDLWDRKKLAEVVLEVGGVQAMDEAAKEEDDTTEQENA